MGILPEVSGSKPGTKIAGDAGNVDLGRKGADRPGLCQRLGKDPIGEDEVNQFALVFGDRTVQLVVVGYLQQLGEPDPHAYRVGADHGRDPGYGVVIAGAEGAHRDQILRLG